MTIKKLRKKIMVNRGENILLLNYKDASKLYEGCFNDIPVEYYSGKVRLISYSKKFDYLMLFIYLKGDII